MKYITVGNRIPRDYFVTKGSGESDITEHAGSFHMGLKSAGIETANIMTYSSILPSIAREIPRPHIEHGEVMECIMSSGTVEHGDSISVGIIYGWLYDRISEDRYGGIVCECQLKNADDDKLFSMLSASLEQLYINGFFDNYLLKDISTITQSVCPRKKYGTAIAAICFKNYVVPVIE